MNTWIIEPRDALIARDGRPFTAGEGAKSLPFPYPSTTTGGLRTRSGLDNDGVFSKPIEYVKSIEVRGPLLVQLDNMDTIVEWFMPAPSDAMLLEIEGDSTHIKLHRLSPQKGGLTNLPDGLHPVYLNATGDQSKPSNNAPRYWRWHQFEKWLIDPDLLANREHEPFCLGHNGPVSESRIHVKVLYNSQAASESDLFQTSGLEFRHRVNKRRCEAERLALSVHTSEGTLPEGLAHLGGERRLICWREGKAERDLFKEECPQVVRKGIVATKECRVILLTPAYFNNGVMPTWLCDQTVHGFKPTVKAIANHRYQVVSGWDFEHRRPKPTRRLIPAGSVLWFDLSAATQDKQIEDWINRIWMNCVSDDDEETKNREQHRKDGFGLSVLGI
jgi:CRISPR-associated protein Cmr3